MQDLLHRDAAVISRQQALRFSPLAAIGRKNARLKLEEGREVVDFSAGGAPPALAMAAM